MSSLRMLAVACAFVTSLLGGTSPSRAALTANALTANALTANALTAQGLAGQDVAPGPALSDLNGVVVEGVVLAAPRP